MTTDTSSHEDTGRDRTSAEVTVLVVDDEVDIATYLASVLEDAGMHVLIAHDGNQALELVARHRPDLISLDLVMPGKSGIRVLRELRRNRDWSHIPVLIVTAHARDPQVRGDLEAVLADSAIVGPSSYLEKPVTPASFLDSVCRVLGVRPVDDAADSASDLRRQAQELLEAADQATLEAVVGRLRRGAR